MTKITFIGAGSTTFTKNIAGDILQRPALANAEIRLMDINPQRLEESEIIVGKLARTLGGTATVKTYRDQRAALDGTDFVVCCFQVGGYDPCTITDFEVPKAYGLRQTIADTLGIGGIMRGLRTVPHLWSICDDLRQVAPNAIMLQYVNPMAINTWAIAAKYPDIRQVGLCHSVQGTAMELARDLDVPVKRPPLQGRRHQPHGLLPQLRAAPERRLLQVPLPGALRRLPGRAHPQALALERALPQQGALRDDDPPRLLRDRELRAFRRIHAVVHQARPPGPDREVRHPARRIPQALRRADRPLGKAGRRLQDRQRRSRSRTRRSTPARS